MESLYMVFSTKSASVTILNRQCWIFQMPLRSILVSLFTYNLRQKTVQNSCKRFFYVFLRFFTFILSSDIKIFLQFAGAILIFPKMDMNFERWHMTVRPPSNYTLGVKEGLKWVYFRKFNFFSKFLKVSYRAGI